MRHEPLSPSNVHVSGWPSLCLVLAVAAMTVGFISSLGRLRSQPELGGRELRVCADPNNLPFSNDREEGFENQLAKMVADDLGLPVHYTWWTERRGFMRNTLNAQLCDLVMGVAANVSEAWTTLPYYRSGYVFVSRADRGLDVGSLDDDRLGLVRIGVQLVGDDFASPPAQAMASRGWVRNVVGYSVLADDSQPNPHARIVDAVVRGDVDVAVVWGPLAGFFASRERVPLVVTPIPPDPVLSALPFEFDIAMAVRAGDAPFRDKLNGFINRQRDTIGRLLDRFHVPRVVAHGGQT